MGVNLKERISFGFFPRIFLVVPTFIISWTDEGVALSLSWLCLGISFLVKKRRKWGCK